MDFRLSIREKLFLALGLNAFFYSVILYVNLEGEARSWQAVFGKHFGLRLSEYLLGTLSVFGWMFLAEFLFGRITAWFGEEEIRKGSPLPLVTAIAMFLVVNLGANYGTLMAMQWVQTTFLGRAEDAILRTEPYSLMALRFSYAIYIIMELFVYYLLVHRLIRMRLAEAAVRAEKARRSRIENQYANLRSRVNPHFLFNSLSTLASLVHVDGERSEQFIDRLSQAYRYMLENRETSTVPLQAELAFLRAYAFLLETRFGNKFGLEIRVAPSLAERLYVVPLTLQAIVDESLKTNRFSSQSPLVIVIGMEGDELVLQHNSQPRAEPDRTIGDWDWRILEQCYQALLPDDRAIRRRNTNGVFSVRIPLLSPTVQPVKAPAYG